LEQAYRSATCLLAASYGEGFGLPLIEAAEHGLALLVRDIPVFREVARASASYFTAATPEAMADAVAEWLDLYERGRYPRSLSLRRTSWERMSRELLTVLGFEAGDHRAA
jgi:glycosyltransferase involved in cell wall biosynthesis